MELSTFSAYAVTDRLLDWTEQASLAGRRHRAETLLLLAWEAYDRSRNVSRPRPYKHHFRNPTTTDSASDQRDCMKDLDCEVRALSLP
jgi:hypothetical protein